MFKAIPLALPLAAFAMLALPAAAVAEPLSFTLTNDASAEVVGFYVSPVGVDDWEENLVIEPIEPGESAEATIADGRGVCDYDLKVEFIDVEPVIEPGIDLCDIEIYRLRDAD